MQSAGQAVVGVIKSLQPLLHRAIEGGIAVGTFCLSWKMYWWAATWLQTIDPAHLVNAAAAVAAVLAPLSTLQGYVLAKYIRSCVNGNGNGHKQ